MAGYVRKKVAQKVDPNHYTRVDPDSGELHELEKEFSRMSLKPAIGKRWIEKYWSEVYPADQVVVDGKTFRPPRYYDKWMDQHHPQIMFDVRLQRDAQGVSLEPEKLTAKEKIHQARVSLFQTRGKV